MWSCRLSTISKVRLNINSCYTRKIPGIIMHQIAPLTTSKCKQLSLWEGGTPSSPSPPPPPRSLRSLARYFLPPPLKLNPGYATDGIYIYHIERIQSIMDQVPDNTLLCRNTWLTRAQKRIYSSLSNFLLSTTQCSVIRCTYQPAAITMFTIRKPWMFMLATPNLLLDSYEVFCFPFLFEWFGV